MALQMSCPTRKQIRNSMVAKAQQHLITDHRSDYGPLFSTAGRYNSPMRYRLRTLLIAVALGPPLLMAAWFAYIQPAIDQQRALRLMREGERGILEAERKADIFNAMPPEGGGVAVDHPAP